MNSSDHQKIFLFTFSYNTNTVVQQSLLYELCVLLPVKVLRVTCRDDEFIACHLEVEDKKGTIVMNRSPMGIDGTVDHKFLRESVRSQMIKHSFMDTKILQMTVELDDAFFRCIGLG